MIWQTNPAQGKIIAQYSYNKLGKLATKKLSPAWNSGNGLETLNYDYTVRNWLRSINRYYANGNNNDHFFGMTLNYDYGFSQGRYTGDIAGTRWRTSGDGERRAYGFTYDDADRLTKADFTQYTGGWNQSAGVNYNVSNLAYDANGNIKTMTQMGLTGASSGTVDNMEYHYLNSENSNRLDYVKENGGTTTKLGDFKDAHAGSGDYVYDTDGNLTKDLNKGIGSITYNYLNLPETITFTGNGSTGSPTGNIKFVYDAVGNKLQKIVTDQTTSPTKTTTTDYINGFVYQNDTLQFFPTEEGRVRTIIKAGQPVSYVYDYFIKDHLGNTRVVLTEQTDFSQYMATMEQPKTQTEDSLFYNLDRTRTPKPVDYPQDNTTTPNTAVARLNGKDPDKRIGPSIILKVMAGDTIQAAVRAFYRQQATKQNNAGLPAEQMLGGLVEALVAPALQSAVVHNMRLAPDAKTMGPGLTAGDLRNMKQRDPDNNKTDKPKAYLNYVFFDKQFKFVGDGSGVKQVDGEAGQLETLSSGKVVAKKNGYVYVYTSNESSQDVLFDNFGVMQITGPVLEETHYYPFGLTMAGISSTAPLKLANNYKYNSKELNHKEFSDGSGLDWYSYGDREYDPQTGSFHALDPYAEIAAGISPYSYALNNPVLFMDINGDSTVPAGNVRENWGNFDTQNNTVGLKELTVTASRSYSGYYDPLYTGAFSSLHVNWIRSFGKGVRNASIWFNQNLNPVYLAFNGINSQFTGMDYLTGDPVSHVDGFVQAASAIPIGEIARLGEIGLGSLERLVAEDAAKGGTSLVQANRTAGNLFRDELAAALRAEGRTVETEVYMKTPFGKRYIDIDVWHNGVNLGGIETKVGGSRYLPLQRLKDAWLGTKKYPVQLVRKPTNW